jgi:hypothetical protein
MPQVVPVSRTLVLLPLHALTNRKRMIPRAASMVLDGRRQRFSRTANSPNNPMYSPLDLLLLRCVLKTPPPITTIHHSKVLAGELLWNGVSAREVRSKIADGERPRMPEGMTEFGITAEMWGMLNRCWEMEAEERITVSGVLSFLEYT